MSSEPVSVRSCSPSPPLQTREEEKGRVLITSSQEDEPIPSNDQIKCKKQKLSKTMKELVDDLSPAADKKDCVFNAVDELGDLIKEDKKQGWNLVCTHGGIPTIINIMKQYNNWQDLLENSIYLLCRLIEANKDFAANIFDAGAVELTFNAMKDFPEDTEDNNIQFFGIELFDTLMEINHDEAVHTKIFQVGADKYIMDKMKEFPQNRDMQEWGMSFVARCIKSCYTVEGNQVSNKIKQMDICKKFSLLVEPVLKSFVHDIDIIDTVGWILWHLAEEKPNREHLLKSNVGEVVSYAIHHVEDDMKGPYMTLYLRMVQEHAKKHKCYKNSGIKGECPFAVRGL